MVLCEKVGSSIHVLDPMSLQRAEVPLILSFDRYLLMWWQISADVYWRSPFHSICSAAHLIEYMVMDMDPVFDAKGAPVTRGKVIAGGLNNTRG